MTSPYGHPLHRTAGRPPADRDLAHQVPEGITPASTEPDPVVATAVPVASEDIAYSEAMRRLHETYPDDDEIATLYALSLLGTVRRGDKGFGRQVRAGAIAMQVFARNPKHPGAAHFIIHAFDDPQHAILALPAARVYAEIAPAAPPRPAHAVAHIRSARDVGRRRGFQRGRPTRPRSSMWNARVSRAAGRNTMRCSGSTPHQVRSRSGTRDTTFLGRQHAPVAERLRAAATGQPRTRDELGVKAQARDRSPEVVRNRREHRGSVSHEAVEPFAHDVEGLHGAAHLHGAGFGRRAALGHVVEATEAAAASGKPVQVVWTREDDNPPGSLQAGVVDAHQGRGERRVRRHGTAPDQPAAEARLSASTGSGPRPRKCPWSERGDASPILRAWLLGHQTR